MKFRRTLRRTFLSAVRLGCCFAALCFLVAQTGCVGPIGAEKTSPARAYRQTHENPISHGQISAESKYVLRQFQQQELFTRRPEVALAVVHKRAVDSGSRRLLYALSELNYAAAERLRQSVKPWETRDPRDYYLASAVYAWLFLFGEAVEPPPSAFDPRFRSASDLYGFSLGRAFSDKRGTNASAILAGGVRKLPLGELEIKFNTNGFPWNFSSFDKFLIADQFRVRGLSLRNRQPGLGTPLVAVTKESETDRLRRVVPATALLRIDGQAAELSRGRVQASLELYSGYEDKMIQVAGESVPLETDTTIATAYLLNQPLLWKLGMMQFLSAEEKVKTDVYMTQPYCPGRVPVVFVHGTFSSPVWWAEMANVLAADPLIRQKYQFWHFAYNTGNPVVFSAKKLRDSLAARIQKLDPEGHDPALRQMVVIGHSQGGLLTKLTATATGDKLLEALLKTNQVAQLNLSADHLELLRQYTCFEALPFVKRVVFISTPHRGSYLAGSFARALARKFVTLPGVVAKTGSELSGLTERLDLPSEVRGAPTSLDGMSPRNPVLLALAKIPLASGVKGHSIVAVQGNGDFHHGKDGLVSYDSAHVDYVESEFIVRSFHSCQANPATIEEVRRILHEHLASLSPEPKPIKETKEKPL